MSDEISMNSTSGVNTAPEYVFDKGSILGSLILTVEGAPRLAPVGLLPFVKSFGAALTLVLPLFKSRFVFTGSRGRMECFDWSPVKILDEIVSLQNAVLASKSVASFSLHKMCLSSMQSNFHASWQYRDMTLLL